MDHDWNECQRCVPGLFRKHGHGKDLHRRLYDERGKIFHRPIDKTVVADNTWRDVDISAETGGDTAIGAIFTVLTTAGASRSYALRKKGSSDDRFSDLRAETPTLGLIGVDANELAQLRIESLGGLELRLEGYVTDGAVFFDNATPKSTGTTGSYQSVDITGDLLGSDNANGAIAEIHPWGRATPTATRTLPPASPTITSWKTSRPPGRRSFTARSRRRPWQGFRLLVLIPARAISSSSEDNHTSLITYGNPSASSLRVVKRDRWGVVLELETAGFFATPQEDGTVRLEIPGFEALTEANAPEIPVKRSWVEGGGGSESGARVRESLPGQGVYQPASHRRRAHRARRFRRRYGPCAAKRKECETPSQSRV